MAHDDVKSNAVERAIGSMVAGIALWSARHAKLVIAVVLVITLAFGYGLTQIYVRSADYDLLPNGHPSTIANDHALGEVPGYRSIETLWVEMRDPRGNISSPGALRAEQESVDYVVNRVNAGSDHPLISYTYSLPYLVKLINYTASGVPNPAVAFGQFGGVPVPPGAPPQSTQPLKTPDPAAFSMPPDDQTLSRDYSIIAAADPAAIEGVTNENMTGTILIFMYDFNLTKAGPQEVLPASHKFLQAVDDFRTTGCAQSKFHDPSGGTVLNCDHIYVLGEAINAHMTDLANEDFKTFGPIVFVVTLVILVFAFNDLMSMLIASLSFTFGLVWTYGFMGYDHIPLTFFGLLIVPITLGVGKEYAIYVTNQYLEYTARGETKEKVLELVGHRAGAALIVATVTSVAGIATMYFANFKIMTDLATLTIFAFTSLMVLSITFIPAAHSLRNVDRRKVKTFSPSRSMGAIGRSVSRHKIAIGAVVLVGTLLLAYSATNIEEYFGISGGFKKGDYLEQSYQYYNQVLGGSGTELVVVEGDITDPATLHYINTLDGIFKADKDTIPKTSNVNSIIIALNTYFALKDGLLNPNALKTNLGKQTYPDDKQQLSDAIDTMFAEKPWQPVIALFAGKDKNIAITHVFYRIKSETFDGLETDWNSLNADIAKADKANAAGRPASIKAINLVGTQDTFYLYVKYGQPWLTYVSLMASGLTFLIAVIILQKPRDVLAVMVPMTLASIWWAGLLPLFDIKASLTLMLPTVFLISVGSDYAIQYVWNYRQIGDMGEVYESTGKANLFVVIATVVAFLLFVPMKLVLSSQGALAAALAILTIFVVTTIVVPLFYRKAVRRARGKDAARVEAATQRATPSGATVVHAPPRPERTSEPGRD
ncbi:MAG: MMPL family transporter [Thermoplasmatota archaeon]